MSLSVYITSVLAFLCYGYLLFVGWRRGMARQLPLFFGFIAFSVLRDLAGWLVIAIWDTESVFTWRFYSDASLLTAVGQILLLIQIYYVIKLHRDKGHWVVLGVFSALMTWYCWRQQGTDFYLVFQNIALYFQVLFCILLNLQFSRNRSLYLGGNYIGILFGLSLMIAVQSVNYGLAFFQFINPALFYQLVQPLSLISLIIFAAAMRKLDLPRRIEPAVIEEVARFEATLREAARSMR